MVMLPYLVTLGLHLRKGFASRSSGPVSNGSEVRRRGSLQKDSFGQDSAELQLVLGNFIPETSGAEVMS